MYNQLFLMIVWIIKSEINLIKNSLFYAQIMQMQSKRQMQARMQIYILISFSVRFPNERVCY